MKTERYIVRGRVQGVGFRHFVYIRAREIGVSGYVKNLPDGSVEAFAQGSPEQLQELYSTLKDGPGLSRVTEVNRFEENLPAGSSFDIRY